MRWRDAMPCDAVTAANIELFHVHGNHRHRVARESITLCRKKHPMDQIRANGRQLAVGFLVNDRRLALRDMVRIAGKLGKYSYFMVLADDSSVLSVPLNSMLT